METRDTQPFLLGEWLVRPAENRLFGPLGERRLEPRVMQLLCRLAEAGSGTVRRATLLSELWWEKDVGDEVLSTAVSALRRALGDDFRSPRYVETVPKTGYRLVQKSRSMRAGGDTLTQTPRGEPGSAGAESEAAWLFRMGRYHFDRRSADNLTLCKELFEQAVEADPGYAPAYAWLALVCQFMPAYLPLSDPAVVRRARDLALAALGLDRDEPIAQMVLGNDAARRLRWREADAYFLSALRAAPGESTIHAAYAEFLSRLGHSRQALEHARRAWQLNGISSGANLILGWMLLHGDDMDVVLRHADLAEQLGARVVFVDNLKGLVCHRRGWRPEDLQLWEQLDARNGEETRWLWPGALVQELAGKRGRAHDAQDLHGAIQRLIEASPEGNGIAFFLYALLGFLDQAFEYATLAVADGSLLVVDPWLRETQALREDPRFDELAANLGLPEAWHHLGPADASN